MITPELLAKIGEAKEVIRWTPLWKQMRDVDYDVLMECLVDQACFWVNHSIPHKPDYAKEFASWMVWFFGSDLKACAERRKDDPIMELKPSYVSEDHYRDYVRRGCELLISEYERRTHHEELL